MMKRIIFFLVISIYAKVVFSDSKFSTSNCTWYYITQPLSHFSRSSSGSSHVINEPEISHHNFIYYTKNKSEVIHSNSYSQRVCVYDGFWSPNKRLPIFFYTGNESPVDLYINNTGLMWNLAEKFNALVVFAEHRYFGESIPNITGMKNCVSYLTSEEALADYAALSRMFRSPSSDWGGQNSAIVAFGGSYGGMLAAWMRIMFPSAIDGAISSSAPIWEFPFNEGPLDGAFSVITRDASPAAGSAPFCANNLKAAYILLSDISRTVEGRALVSKAMCSELTSEEDVARYISYLQEPLFYISEGSYPFPSDYISSSAGNPGYVPAWPMQVMCSFISDDYGIVIDGDQTSVAFSVSVGNVEVAVDWDELSNNGYSIDDVVESGVLDLLTGVANSMQHVWYDLQGLTPLCNQSSLVKTTEAHGRVSMGKGASSNLRNHLKLVRQKQANVGHRDHIDVDPNAEETDICTASKDDVDGWGILVCNDGINLINNDVQGVGNDMLWPPSQAKGYKRDVVIEESLSFCHTYSRQGLYGVPEKPDSWSRWMDTVYGGKRGLTYATNIVFTNGNLDPWSSGGVPVNVNLTSSLQLQEFIANVTTNGVLNSNRSTAIISLDIDKGAHHVDLFWPNDQDPDNFKLVRDLEALYIQSWIEEVESRYLSSN